MSLESIDTSNRFESRIRTWSRGAKKLARAKGLVEGSAVTAAMLVAADLVGSDVLTGPGVAFSAMWTVVVTYIRLGLWAKGV